MKVGIVGAGQLGQMLGLAAKRMNIECIFLDPARAPPAGAVGRVLRHSFDDVAGLEKLASLADVVTYEFENVPVEAIEKITDRVTVYPPCEALRQAQDRLNERTRFDSLGIPVPRYLTADSLHDVRRAVQEIGLPLVLKTRRMGYDGKGQRIISDRSEIADCYESLGGRPLIADQWIEFDREVSAIGARSAGGQIALYPITENRHSDGILRTSRAPFASRHLAGQAEKYLVRLLDDLHYVGVLALEFFVRGDELFANEFAPRVHNSGHWTIEGAVTSQFENHLRAILDMPLGDTGTVGHAGMVNLIGTMPEYRDWPADARIFLHDYGKEARPGRKLGHITVLAESAAERDRQLARISEKISS